MPPRQASTPPWWGASYAAMILAAVGAFLVARHYGEALTTPAPTVHAAAGLAADPNTLFHVLLALVAVIVVGRVLSRVLGAVGQPPVLGEVAAGILLGPSLVGRLAPGVSDYLLPASAAPTLSGLAQIGIVVYMFRIGIELNADLLRRQARTTVIASHASIAALLAIYLYPRLSTSDVPFTSFALFMGVAMSVTAFPVLARILSNRGLTGTTLGSMALARAASGDVTAWCLLALVVGTARARLAGALTVVVSAVVFIAAMFLVVRPMVVRLARAESAHATRRAVAMALVGMLVSALAAESIGIHAIFGAFLFGVMVPHGSALGRALVLRLDDLVTVVLLPAFFALTGMRTQIGLVSGVSDWLICAAITLAATIGKSGGTFLAARVTGTAWRQAASLAVLMNTRGLMEIIVLNVGLDLGVIAPRLFAMTVIMALATTIATAPALTLVMARGSGRWPWRLTVCEFVVTSSVLPARTI